MIKYVLAFLFLGSTVYGGNLLDNQRTCSLRCQIQLEECNEECRLNTLSSEEDEEHHKQAADMLCYDKCRRAQKQCDALCSLKK